MHRPTLSAHAADDDDTLDLVRRSGTLEVDSGSMSAPVSRIGRPRRNASGPEIDRISTAGRCRR